MPGTLSRTSFAILAGAYLLPALAALSFAVLLLPMHLSRAPDAMQLATSLGAFVAAFVSLLAGLWLCVGWFRRGRAWLSARPWALKLLALFAPGYIAYQAWAALQMQRLVLSSADAAALGQDYIDAQLAAYGGVMAWSLLFLLPLAIMVLHGRKQEP